MVDLSHVALRELVRERGGCDLFYSEMLNSRIIPSENPQHSPYLRWTRSDDLIFQLAGSDADLIERCTTKLDGYAPFGIDINMGCWLKKVTAHGWGVALMQDFRAAAAVTSAARRATSRPLSVKLRIGYSQDRALLFDFADMLQDKGADFIVLHARTAQDGLSRRARWEYIAALKDHLLIPVIGNGDVKEAGDALAMLRQTGCDGVMVGRAALRQPWIFRDIKHLLSGDSPPEPPDLMEVMLRLSHLVELHFPADVAIKRFRVALPWLAATLTFGHFLAKETLRAPTLDAMRSIIRRAFADGIT